MSGTYKSSRGQALGPPQRHRIFRTESWTDGPCQGHRVGSLTQETTSYRSRQRKGDEEVVGLDRDIPQSSYDVGHNFTTEKWTSRWGVVGTDFVSYSSGSSGVHLSNPYVGMSFRAPNGRFMSSTAKPDPSDWIRTNDVASGKAAIAATAPTRPVVSLSTVLGELREGLPSVTGMILLKEKVSSARALGSEYLNVQFGWIPFVSDIMSIVKALTNATTILQQYERDSGRNVRRKHRLAPLSVSHEYSGEAISSYSDLSFRGISNSGETTVSGAHGGFYIRGGSGKVNVSAVQQRWFAGSYTYHLPDGTDFFSKSKRYLELSDKLLGVKLTPAVLWELAPWSWLVDWFYDIQSHIEIASLFNQDELVLRYGYLMVQDRVTITSTVQVEATPTWNQPSVYRELFYQNILETKRRVRSTPFGFGLNASSDFSERQWAILGALGLTKGPRTLR